MLALPVAGYYPWGGTLLEGTGILPDFEIDFDYQASRAGADPQLQQAIATVNNIS